MPDPTQLVLTLGAAGALLYVLRLLTQKEPGLHTHSEVAGLRKDKADLLAVNSKLSAALQESNETLREVLGLKKQETSDVD